MRRVEMTLVFQVDIHDDDVDVDDLCLEFDCESDAMEVGLASDTSTKVKADIKGYETTAVDVTEEDC